MECAKCSVKIPKYLYVLNQGFCEDCYLYIKANNCCTVCFEKVYDPDNEDDCVCFGCEGKMYRRQGGKTLLKKRITYENNHWISNQNDNIAKNYEEQWHHISS